MKKLILPALALALLLAGCTSVPKTEPVTSPPVAESQAPTPSSLGPEDIITIDEARAWAISNAKTVATDQELAAGVRKVEDIVQMLPLTSELHNSIGIRLEKLNAAILNGTTTRDAQVAELDSILDALP